MVLSSANCFFTFFYQLQKHGCFKLVGLHHKCPLEQSLKKTTQIYITPAYLPFIVVSYRGQSMSHRAYF